MKGKAIIFRKMFMKVAITLSAILLFTMASAATAEEHTVMTRNLYLGAEIQSLVYAETLEEFLKGAQEALAKIAATNFPARAEALAAEIIEKKPHLIGLQEVYNFTLDGFNGPPPFRDHLTDLLDALAAQGAYYEVAAVVKDMDIVIPVPDFGLVGVVDRDVILARGDVMTEVVDLTGFCQKTSVDGCNYWVIAAAETPVGTISIERGFVAVDAWIGNLPVRFVNTHLEVRDVDPTNPLSPAIQAAQAFELINILALLPNPDDVPLIIAGDINSSPEDPVLAPPGLPTPIVPPYKQLVSAAYLDTWTLRPGNPKAYTCCQAEDLLNPESILYERIDVIFTSEEPDRVKANTVGNDEDDRLPSGLWPSDHAGVVARMEVAP